ncbi:peptide deformylase [Prosthecodimorpha staleyi]|uniref:Peptide deformylase n=1 Tax=Prosthecodimorpha staleyi TaxID=2840188 RepID=A0A947D716_9HYPH|nr:peptide deformylase [Prosthecodimorpha staleyi]MBT9291294.1 peptide deformylase [Prosthecodimorpha staleyi]
MSKLDIVIIPDQRLKQKSEVVTSVDGSIRRLLDDMLETMYAAPGIGLAAVQVGVMQRVVTIDVSKEEDKREPLFLVNPEIVWSSEELSTYEEGCLSIPDYYEVVERTAKVGVRYLDRQGETRELEADGLLATCLQHEIDHLDGVLFIDHLSKLKRDRVMKKFQKQARLKEQGLA